jgi:hypothetical protein
MADESAETTDKDVSKDVSVDAIGLDMYRLNVIGDANGVRRTHKELAEQFNVSERTVQRKLSDVRIVVEKVEKLINTIPESSDNKSNDTVKQDTDTTPPAGNDGYDSGVEKHDKKPPGRVSRGVLNQNSSTVSHPSSSNTLVAKYNDEFRIPETNPLSALEDIHSMARVGSAAGIAVGSAASEVIDALGDTEGDFGDRLLKMTRGSSTLGATLLGIIATVQKYNPPKK